jgi:hypothetical protein
MNVKTALKEVLRAPSGHLLHAPGFLGPTQFNKVHINVTTNCSHVHTVEACVLVGVDEDHVCGHEQYTVC